MRKIRTKTIIVGVCAISRIVFGAEVLAVKQNAVVLQSNPVETVPDFGELRAARDPAGFGKQIYLQFDASVFSAAVSQVESLEAYALALKYPRGSEVYLIKGADAWSAEELTWDNAPGNDRTSAARVDLSESIKLGTLPSVGDPVGQTVSIQWESPEACQALVDALNSESRIVTLAVLRTSTREVVYASLKSLEFGAHPFRMSVTLK